MSDEKALAPYQRNELTPAVLDMFMQLDQAAYKSRRFGVTEGETAIKLLFCYETGLPLSAANTGLYVVNGRMEAMGNIIAAQIRRHPDYDYRIVSLNDAGCTIEILRHGEPVGQVTFDESHAQRAGLMGKDNYQKYPDDMFFNRAISKAYKRFAPDIFSMPVYVRGEISGDPWEIVDAEPVPVDPEDPAVTMDDLLAEFGAEAIITANDGKIPATDAEVAEVAEVLRS